jgi:hypothetical protein
MNDLGESQLNRMYEDFTKEQTKLQTELRNGVDDISKQKDIEKQLVILNTIATNIIRLRTLKKQILEKSKL